ncbi:hypothetical protein JNM05_14875 [bacterium]|nr:hypothetical protein [bacterium]
MTNNNSLLISTAIILCFSLFHISCPDEVNPPEPRPGGVKIKAHNGTTFQAETGLRPLEGIEERIRIEWSPLTSNENNIIEEYLIYRSNGIDSPYVQIGNRLVDFAEEDSFFIDENVFEDVTYRYFIFARNSKDKITDTSAYFGNSDYIKSIRLGHKVENLGPPPADTANTKPKFTWCLGIGLVPIKYIVKLATLTGQIIWIAEKQPGTFDGDCFNQDNHEYLTFHNASYSADDSLQIKTTPFVTVHYVNQSFFDAGRLRKGNAYSWRVDCIYDGAESKSRWTTFSVTKDYINPN